MSDLVPFVSAVFRDRSLIALKDENHELCEEMSRRDAVDGTIRITGPNGLYPTYAHALIRDGEQFRPDDVAGHWEVYVALAKSTPADFGRQTKVDARLPTCPVQDIEKCVLHVGGKKISMLGDFDMHCERKWFSRGRGHEFRYYCFESTNQLADGGPHFRIVLRVLWGPIKNDDGEIVRPSAYKNEDVESVQFSDVWIEDLAETDNETPPAWAGHFSRLMQQLASTDWQKAYMSYLSTNDNDESGV